jgi:hypothetical protein
MARNVPGLLRRIADGPVLDPLYFFHGVRLEIVLLDGELANAVDGRQKLIGSFRAQTIIVLPFHRSRPYRQVGQLLSLEMAQGGDDIFHHLHGVPVLGLNLPVRLSGR